MTSTITHTNNHSANNRPTARWVEGPDDRLHLAWSTVDRQTKPQPSAPSPVTTADCEAPAEGRSHRNRRRPSGRGAIAALVAIAMFLGACGSGESSESAASLFGTDGEVAGPSGTTAATAADEVGASDGNGFGTLFDESGTSSDDGSGKIPADEEDPIDPGSWPPEDDAPMTPDPATVPPGWDGRTAFDLGAGLEPDTTPEPLVFGVDAGWSDEMVGMATADVAWIYTGIALECLAGDDEACDALYYETPVGSTWEQVGITCGGQPRFDPICDRGDEPFAVIESNGWYESVLPTLDPPVGTDESTWSEFCVAGIGMSLLAEESPGLPTPEQAVEVLYAAGFLSSWAAMTAPPGYLDDVQTLMSAYAVLDGAMAQWQYDLMAVPEDDVMMANATDYITSDEVDDARERLADLQRHCGYSAEGGVEGGAETPGTSGQGADNADLGDGAAPVDDDGDEAPITTQPPVATTQPPVATTQPPVATTQPPVTGTDDGYEPIADPALCQAVTSILYTAEDLTFTIFDPITTEMKVLGMYDDLDTAGQFAYDEIRPNIAAVQSSLMAVNTGFQAIGYDLEALYDSSDTDRVLAFETTLNNLADAALLLSSAVSSGC